MNNFTPCLWVDHQAEDAATFYTALFPNSRIVHIARSGKAEAQASGRPLGSVMTVAFQLDGHDFLALNGGPAFTLSPATSFFIACLTQQEIDRYWDALAVGGRPMECGWVTDRFGVSWQVVPAQLGEWMQDPATCERVMGALLTMQKLDLATLQRAAYAA